jgi:dTDP-glucose 4,6-dehydratase
MEILVTGGAGFIGSHFVDFLLSLEPKNSGIKKVVVIDKLTYAGSLKNLEGAFKDPRFEFVKSDIKNNKIMMKLMKDDMTVINFAAESHVDNSINSPGIFYETNVKGVHNILDVTLKYNNVKLIQVSTDEVYGSIDTGKWNEDSSIKPNSPYSASKAAADLMCLAYYKTYNLNVLITRSSNNFGPRQHKEKLIPTIINALKSSQKIPVYGNGNNVRDWLYVLDHVRGIWATVNHGKPGEIYNIGGGTELTNLEVIDSIRGLIPHTYDPIMFIEDRKGHDYRYSLDFSKASEYLGYSPKHKFQESMITTVRSYVES